MSYIYKNWVKLILFQIVLKNRSQSFATFRYKLTRHALECTCKYMVGPSHKVSSSRRETDMRQMSFRTWTLQLIKCLNGVGKFHLLWNASHVFHNEYFLIQYQISNNIPTFDVYFIVSERTQIHDIFSHKKSYHFLIFGKNFGQKMFSETIKYVNITHLILNSEAAAIKYTLVYVPA